jgi:hypothetical protein
VRGSLERVAQATATTEKFPSASECPFHFG